MGQRQGKKTLCRRRPRVRASSQNRDRVGFNIFTRCADRRYYEWLKKGTHRIPHFTRHKDRRLMLFAGLYDSVTLDGEYMLY